MTKAAGGLKRAVKGGDPFIWLTGGALVMSLLMVAGLLGLIMVKGLGFFWPADLVAVTLEDGSCLLGQQTDREAIAQSGGTDKDARYRIQLKIGNRDLYGLDFRWIDEEEIAKTDRPESAVVIERREWGNFHGFLSEVRRGERILAAGEEDSWRVVTESLPETERIRARIEDLEKREISRVSYRLEDIERELRKAAGEAGVSAEGDKRISSLKEEAARLKEQALDI